MEHLTDGDKVSPAYRKIMSILEHRLETARGKLEGNLTLDETNRVRGRIIELKYLLSLDKDPEHQPPAL